MTIHLIAPPDNIATLILAQKLDAAIYYIGPEIGANLVERSNIDLRHHPDIRSLFPDPVAEGVRYFRKTGIYPINHALVLNREMAQRHPWLPVNLYKGFQRAINIMCMRRMDQARYYVDTGLISREAGLALSEPVVKYGVEVNRKVLEKYAEYAFDFGVIPKRVNIDQGFAPSTLGF